MFTKTKKCFKIKIYSRLNFNLKYMSLAGERKQKLNKNLDKILKSLKKKYNPEKIILFGSLASGKVGEWSDIDLLIVKNTRKNALERKKEVDNICDVNIAFDPIIFTPQEVKERLRWKDYFIQEILNKGKLLYERH